jgi:spore germination cell wall hydrolase CwlJ-like protein
MRYIFLSCALVPSILATGMQTETAPTSRIVFGEPTIVSVGFQPDPVEVKCLATMVYGEARGEPEIGQVAVAYTAVNRAGNSKVCDAVLAPKQYSVFNDNPALVAAAKNPQIEPSRVGMTDTVAWKLAVSVAQKVLRKKVKDPTKGSTHYLAPAAMEALGYEYPQWSREFEMTTVIYSHQFYKQEKKVAYNQ